MSSIKFNNLKAKKTEKSNYTYVDIKLDLEEANVTFEDNFLLNNGKGRDIKVCTDIDAIKNSLLNLFNTTPGERLLLPEYGCDLRQFLFTPISKNNANSLARTIRDAIETYETRINYINVDVTGYIEEQYYNIVLVIGVPFLTEKISLSGIFNRNGYFFNS